MVINKKGIFWMAMLIMLVGVAIPSVLAVDIDYTVGLEIAYPLDNSSLDSSGNGRDGTKTATCNTNTPGVINTSCFFDGTNYITPSNVNFVLNKTFPFSTSFWLNFNETTSNSRILMGEWENPGNNWILYKWSGTNSLRFEHAGGFCGISNDIGTSACVNTDCHIAFTLNDTCNFYINGVIQNLTADSTPQYDGGSTANDFIIGEWSTLDFKGWMDEILIYNRTLNYTEVKSLNQCGLENTSFADCNTTAPPTAPTITLLHNYSIDENNTRLAQINTSNLLKVEAFILNFTITNVSLMDTWVFNFTSAGHDACALGNQQESNCYNNTNTVNRWITFINNTDTPTYNGTIPFITGEGIKATVVRSGNTLNVSIELDQHNAPNTEKAYGAKFDTTDIKYQSGVSQRIHRDNFIYLNLTTEFIPVDADQYLIEMVVNHTIGGFLPAKTLDVHLCNETYRLSGYGDPAASTNCVLVAEQFAGQLRGANNDHFRAIFTQNVVDVLINIDSAVISSEESSPNKYYYIETMGIQNANHIQEWMYSTDDGATYTNLADGYEHTTAIHWWAGALTGETAFVYNLWANQSDGTSSSITSNMTWSINTTHNYPPLVEFITPTQNQSINTPFTITCNMLDPNDDKLNGTLFLLNADSSVNLTLASGFNSTNCTYEFTTAIALTQMEFRMDVFELGTTDLFEVNITEEVFISNQFGDIVTVTIDELTATNVLSTIFNLNYTVTCEASLTCLNVWRTVNVTGTACTQQTGNVTTRFVGNLTGGQSFSERSTWLCSQGGTYTYTVTGNSSTGTVITSTSNIFISSLSSDESSCMLFGVFANGSSCAIGSEVRKVGSSLAITIFMLTIIGTLYALPFKVERFSSNEISDFAIKRSLWSLATFLLLMTSAMMATIAEYAGINLTQEIFRMMWVVGLVGWLMLIWLVLGTLFKVINLWKIQTANKKVKEDEYDEY